MPIIVYCESCGKKNRAADTSAGKKGRCAGCGQIMRIPMVSQDEPAAPPEARASKAQAPSVPAKASASASKSKAVAAKSNRAVPAAPPPSYGYDDDQDARPEVVSSPGRSGSETATAARPSRTRIQEKPSYMKWGLAIGSVVVFAAAVGLVIVFVSPHKQPVAVVDLSDEGPSTPRARPAASTETPPAPPPMVRTPAPVPVPPTPQNIQTTPDHAKSTAPSEAKSAETLPETPPATQETTPATTPATTPDDTAAQNPPKEPVKPVDTPEPPADVKVDQAGFLFGGDLQLSVRLDFYWPNGKTPDANYFAIGSERDRRFPWTEILLVDSRPGVANATNNKVQIRAKVRGLKALIDKGDPRAERFPVRIYRTFVNDLEDGEDIYANAFTKLFGKAPKDNGGKVKEPDGRVIVLKRIKEIAGEDAVFVSDVIDVLSDKDLNPALSAVQPPSFAASDGDVYYTQMRKTMGDEEPDAWAFGQAMKNLGFVSAGVAHPNSKRFAPSRGGEPYQFSISAKELLNIRSTEAWEEMSDASAIDQTRKLLTVASNSVMRERLKNLGGSKVTGRPVTNGAFLVSTGVQKLVVTAMGTGRADTNWRFPGVVHVTDGYMDQCLIRAPAAIYMYSGHGWNVSSHGKAYAFINLYPRDNLAAFSDKSFTLYATSYLPNNDWEDCGAAEENKVILSEKWKKEELRMQWLFLVGCDVLMAEGDPFKKWRSNCGTFGYMAIKQLGLKGMLGFSEHGFTCASLMKRFVERASTVGMANEWMQVFRDDDSRRYTWYETNETYGRSKMYTFNELSKKVPAYLIRRENVNDRLMPDTLQQPIGKDTVEFYELRDGVRKVSGVFSE